MDGHSGNIVIYNYMNLSVIYMSKSQKHKTIPRTYKENELQKLDIIELGHY